MAYMNQERKAQIAPAVKAILKRYGVKGSLATDRQTLILNIKSGTLDFMGNYNETVRHDRDLYQYPLGEIPVDSFIQVYTNNYERQFRNKVIRKFFDEVLRAMNVGNYNNSDSQTDYFDVGWYVSINVGKWNKPYVLEK